MNTFDPAFAIKVAADDIAHLRRCDVYRVLGVAPPTLAGLVAEYITEHRPDLKEKVQEVMEELGLPLKCNYCRTGEGAACTCL